MARINIMIDMGSDSYSELDNLQSEKGSLPKLINLLKSINSGVTSGSVRVDANTLAYNSLLTVSASGQVEDETFSVNDVSFTLKDDLSGAGSTGTWVEISATPATMASNMAQGIEGYKDSDVRLSGAVGATASSGVVTVYAKEAGKQGNAVTVSESATNVAASVGVTGTNGTSTTVTSG